MAPSQLLLAPRPIFEFYLDGYRYDVLRFITRHPDTDETGLVVAPHWRRGHWRNQACGPKMTLHKHIFIQPVLVNEYLLTGDSAPATTSVTYREVLPTHSPE
jgi:hypothetical protein